MSSRTVSPLHGQSSAQRVVKQTLLGKMLLALVRGRRMPYNALRSHALAQRDQSRPSPPVASRRVYRGIYVIPVGPGERAALQDTIESVLHFEGEDVRIVVGDDGTVDSRRWLIRQRHPMVDVVRARWPTGGQPLAPLLADLYRHVLAQYEFDVVCKLDADALVTGPGLIARAAEAFADDPSIGLLGGCAYRADGLQEDYSYDAWVLAHSRRWSPGLRRMVRAAQAHGYCGPRAHGGVYLLSRDALQAADETGNLHWRLPWWSLVTEDLYFSLMVYASGLRVASWGAPGQPLASGQGFLPVDKEQVLAEGRLAVHSVRRGLRGESEAELRAFFRRAREPG